MQCFLAHGNHDPLSGWEAGLSIPDGAIRFGGDRVENAIFKRGNDELACIYGISYPSREVRQNLTPHFPKGKNDIFSIGVLHCNVGGSSDHDNYAPCSLDDLLACGMDYWALGHIHTRNVLRDSKPCIIYPGNTQGRNVRESNDRGCYLVRVSDTAQVSYEFISTDVVRWFVEDVNISEIETMDGLMDALHEEREDVRSRADSRSAMLRFYLTGRGELHRQLGRKISEIISSLREGEEERRQFVWVESIQVQTRPAIDILQRRQVEDFVGEFLKAAESLRANPDACAEILALLSSIPGHSIIDDQLGEFTEDNILSILSEAEIMGLDFLLAGED